MNATQRPGLPCYLIVMSQVLVAQDIAMTIRDHDPGATVIVATGVGHALVQLQPVSRLDLAFLTEHPTAFAGSPLARAIALRGGRTVLLGSDAENTGPNGDWDVLAQPFDTQALMARLIRVERA